MRAARVGFASVAWPALAFASACGSLLGSPDDVPPVAVDASSDAPTTPDAPITIDAGIDAPDATTSCKSTSAPVFEQDFTTNDLGNWEPLNSGCEDAGTSYSTRDAGDPAVSLACFTKTLESYNVLQTISGFPSIARTHLSFSFLIGSTESHVFAQLLHVFGAFGANLAFVATASNIEVWDRKGGARLTFWPAGDQKKWRTMEMDLEPIDPIGEKAALRVTLDGVTRNVIELVREVDGGVGQFRLQIGPYANVFVGEFEDAFDAIRIWSCP